MFVLCLKFFSDGVLAGTISFAYCYTPAMFYLQAVHCSRRAYAQFSIDLNYDQKNPQSGLRCLSLMRCLVIAQLMIATGMPRCPEYMKIN